MTRLIAKLGRFGAIAAAGLAICLAARSRAAGDDTLLFAPPAVEDSAAVVAEMPSVAPTLVAATDGYWIVSSRRAAQDARHPAPWGLEYLQVFPNGQGAWSNAASLRAQLTPGVPVCVLIHGSFVEWNEALLETAQAYQWVRAAAAGRPLHVISYSWPGDDRFTCVFPLDVALKGHRAEFNGFHLAHLLSLLPEESPVCMIGHSHGARVVLSSLHLAAGGTVQGLAFTGNIGASRRVRAVLAAAAVDHDWANPGQRYGGALCRAESVINLRNPCDMPLHFYPLAKPFSRPALASVGWTDGDRERLGWLGDRAVEIDVSQLVGRGHMWPDYFTRLELAAMLGPYITFTDVPAPSAHPAAAPPALPVLESAMANSAP